MKLVIAAVVLMSLALVYGQPSGDPLVEGFRLVEVASVADAIEQLYGQRAHMSHEMRPLFTTKFAGPAVTALMKKEEHKQGAPAHGLRELPDRGVHLVLSCGGACASSVRSGTKRRNKRRAVCGGRTCSGDSGTA